MLKSCCFAAAILAAAAMPAFAEGECGSAPIAPAIPTASDLAGKTVEAGRAEVVAAYKQVKVYQSALAPYRACLKSQDDADLAAIAEAKAKGAKEKDKIPPLQDRIAARLKLNNQTVDTEQQVATDFNDLHVAQCVNDTDPKICPKKK
ncbi:MAG TPA: hypothetical protein VGC27_04555 [Rhizomicrobium sp.]